MNKKARVKELETRLRIIKGQLFKIGRGSRYHARDNKKVIAYSDTLRELESLSFKWKIKKIIRRIRALWQK